MAGANVLILPTVISPCTGSTAYQNIMYHSWSELDRQRLLPQVVCINCGEEGHRMRDCSQERNNFDDNGTICRVCKLTLSYFYSDETSQSGHISRECPSRNNCRNCGYILSIWIVRWLTCQRGRSHVKGMRETFDGRFLSHSDLSSLWTDWTFEFRLPFEAQIDLLKLRSRRP